jgi:hypothetical protein
MTAALRGTTAAVSVGLAVAVAGAPLSSPATDHRAVAPAVVVGLVGVAALVVGLLGWAPAVGAAVLLLGGGYGISLIGRGGVFDSGAVFIAAALLLVTETAYWSLDARVRGADDDWPRRAVTVAASAAAGLVAAAAVQAAVTLPAAGGLGLSAAGVAAAVGVLVLADRLARRRPADDPATSR